MDKSIKVKVDVHASGLLLVWEQGGKGKYNASVVIVADKNGNPLTSKIVKTKTNVYNDQHACYPVKKGCLIGIGKNSDSSNCDNAVVGIYTITSIDTKGLVANCKLVTELKGNEFTNDTLKGKYGNIICATVRKLTTSQCLRPSYDSRTFKN